MTEHQDLFDQLVNHLTAPLLQRLMQLETRVKAIERTPSLVAQDVLEVKNRLHNLERGTLKPLTAQDAKEFAHQAMSHPSGTFIGDKMVTLPTKTLSSIAHELEQMALEQEGRTVRFRQPRQQDRINKLKGLAAQLRKFT